ncbi:MAG: hypothetical protein LC808_42490 [Actinobacteria bacterium]|nr:hypothetical protein [Actinomycetota bacterium]
MSTPIDRYHPVQTAQTETAIRAQNHRSGGAPLFGRVPLSPTRSSVTEVPVEVQQLQRAGDAQAELQERPESAISGLCRWRVCRGAPYRTTASEGGSLMRPTVDGATGVRHLGIGKKSRVLAMSS